MHPVDDVPASAPPERDNCDCSCGNTACAADLFLRSAARRGGRLRLALALAALVAGEELDDLLADAAEVRAELDEHLRGDALALVDEAEQDVLGPDVGVVEQARFLLGEDDDPAGPIGETFEHVRPFQRGDDVASVYRAGPERIGW